MVAPSPAIDLAILKNYNLLFTNSLHTVLGRFFLRSLLYQLLDERITDKEVQTASATRETQYREAGYLMGHLQTSVA